MSTQTSHMPTRSKIRDNVSKCNRVSKKRKAEEDPEGTIECVKRRQHYISENNQWVPISESIDITASAIAQTPEFPPVQKCMNSDLALEPKFRLEHCLTTPMKFSWSSLPQLHFADSEDIWLVMLEKELTYTRDPNMFIRHPALHARMRTILLDWLIEVSEVYRLNRESFYLAADFLDRFLMHEKNIIKHQLQLVGITCLFIAAKLEEINPPRLADFAYVTKDTFTEHDILIQELVILKAINWDLTPVTAKYWLSFYLQISNAKNIQGEEYGFVYPQYSSQALVQISKLLDLCILDVGSLQFRYSILAAAALYHNSTRELALSVSGYDWKSILPCVQWMIPFAVIVREQGPVAVKYFPSVPSEDSHIIQTHVVGLDLLEKAQFKGRELQHGIHGTTPNHQALIITQLTPPSDKKSTIGQPRDCYLK